MAIWLSLQHIWSSVDLYTVRESVPSGMGSRLAVVPCQLVPYSGDWIGIVSITTTWNEIVVYCVPSCSFSNIIVSSRNCTASKLDTWTSCLYNIKAKVSLIVPDRRLHACALTTSSCTPNMSYASHRIKNSRQLHKSSWENWKIAPMASGYCQNVIKFVGFVKLPLWNDTHPLKCHFMILTLI
jgi:hypothetical protein